MSTVTIKNDKIEARISTLGAQLISLTDGKKEYMWQMQKDVWNYTAPVLFPICGALENNSFSFEGKTYTLSNHGFARFKEFTVESADNSEVCFLLKDDETTREVYPFEFEFRVLFSVIGTRLNITYSVTNPSDRNIYFSFGGHEGYACDEGVENYFLEFENDDIVTRHILQNSFFNHQTENIVLTDRKLQLEYKEFEKCTYIFRNLNSSYVVLSNKNGERRVKVGFDGHPLLAVWTLPGRKYLCIEPWCGASESIDFDGDITQKDLITELAPGKKFAKKHYIEII